MIYVYKSELTLLLSLYAPEARGCEEGGSKILRSVGIPPHHCTASQPRRARLESWKSQTWEQQETKFYTRIKQVKCKFIACLIKHCPIKPSRLGVYLNAFLTSTGQVHLLAALPLVPVG